MNSANSKIARIFTKLVALSVLVALPASAWEIDLSRRQVDFNRVQNQNRLPAAVKSSEPAGILENVFEAAGPVQDVVIMNTEKGFVPETVYMKKGGSYRIHVVNVNEKEKNLSFVLDAFSEHHNILYGKVKTFTVTPKADGVFTYQCPETALQGKFVIATPEDRKPASR